MKPAVDTAQVTWELEQLLAVFDRARPERVLEIGTWHGGTLWHWLQGGRTVVAVDNTMFEAEEWSGWADDADSELHLVQGDSHDPNVVEQVRQHAPYEFLFIDAGHDYYSVKTDWDNYGPMVVAGGIAVFHDIKPRPDYGVSDLWAELKPGARTTEVWAGREAYCGIGVLWT